MGLYTHTLHLLRESAQGSLSHYLQRAGLVRSDCDSSDLANLLGEPSETRRTDGLTIVEFAPEDGRFDEFLRSRGHELADWLWDAVEKAAVLYAFIPGGGDFKYYEDGVCTDEFQWPQLRELCDTGKVRVLHPLMMFAARLGHGRPYERAKTLNWGLKEVREGVGCLVGFVNPTESGFEILEPGTIYPVLRERWDAGLIEP